MAAAKRDAADNTEIASKAGSDGKKESAADDMESPETSARKTRVYSTDDPEDEMNDAVTSTRADDKRSGSMSPIHASSSAVSGINSGRGTPSALGASSSAGGVGLGATTRSGSTSPVPSHLQHTPSAKGSSPSQGQSASDLSPNVGSGLSPLQPRRTMQALPHHVPKLDSLSRKLDDIRKNMGEEVLVDYVVCYTYILCRLWSLSSNLVCCDHPQ